MPPEHQTQAKSSLCTVCQELPLDMKANAENKISGQRALGKRAAIEAKGYCPLCRLVTAGLKRRSFIPHDSENTLKWDPDRGFHFSGDRERIVFMDQESPASPHWAGRTMKPVVDPSLIRKWLSLCEEHHKSGQCCPKANIIATPEHPDGLKLLRLIDCKQKQIVLARPGCRYVALSYLWGQGKAVLLERKSETWFINGLLGNDFYANLIPRTIRDAIELTSKIGERYLWVDSLCLLQDDADDMMNGIQHMDLVYEGAALTIVAAAGTDNNAGLPGLHDGTRKLVQLSQRIGPGVNIGTVSAIYDLLSSSTYMTRGWTYQELLLSHRCLIFLDSQVFFRCRETVWSEDTLYDDFPAAVNIHTGSSQGIPVLLTPDPHPFKNYAHILFRFNSRHFTKDSDALNAMTGILRYVAANLNSGILEGLPTSCFDVSILFWHQFADSARRRPGFPSWSWAGWAGDTASWIPENDGLEAADWIGGHAHIEWYKRSPATGAVSRVWERDLGQAMSSSSLSVEQGGAGLETRPTKLEGGQLLDYPYTLLQFWTYLVKAPRLGPSPKGYAAVYDCEDQICGALYLDDRSFAYGKGPFEILLLSKCDKSSISKGWLPIEADRPHYWVMLISWKGLVAERKGLGFVLQDRVEFLSPPGKTWTEIILG